MITERNDIDAVRPVAFRGGTVLTLNDAKEVLPAPRCACPGDRITAIRPEPAARRSQRVVER